MLYLERRAVRRHFTFDEDPSAGLKTCILKIKEKQTLKVDKKEKTLGVGLEPLSKKIGSIMNKKVPNTTSLTPAVV